MTRSCIQIREQHRSKIEEIVEAQRKESREAIFFIYEDGSTSDIYKGEATKISLSQDEQNHVLSQGNLIASVHSHPTGFDPSTIDVMTAVMTAQESMCVATPINPEDSEEDFVLTCLDLSGLSGTQRRRLFGAMRRSSVGMTNIGRQLRKQFNFQRFDIDGCRTHKVKVQGAKYPPSGRPSKFEFIIGQEAGVAGELGKEEEYEQTEVTDESSLGNW